MPKWIGYMVATLVCVAFLLHLEVSSFDQNLWQYSPLMPTLFQKIGLTPVGGLLISPTLVFWTARGVCRPQAVSA